MWRQLRGEFIEKKTTILQKRMYAYKMTNSAEFKIYTELEQAPYFVRWFDAGCVAEIMLRRMRRTSRRWRSS